MNSKRSPNELGGTSFLKSGLLLMILATLLAMSSAAPCFGESPGGPEPGAIVKKVVGRGHLTGTQELQQVVTWEARAKSGPAKGDFAHLAIETVERKPRTLWQADEPFPAVVIDSFQVVDLDGDSIPELLCQWWRDYERGADLRVFHWDRRSQSFVELPLGGSDAVKLEAHGYRLEGPKGHKRILVYLMPAFPNREFELRGSEIVRVGGDKSVTKQNESGIEGQAVISPTRPGPVREGQSDSAPFKTTLVILRAGDGSEVARVETGSDGRFRVALPPGTYKVGPPEGIGRRLPRAGQETVTVVPGRFAQVTISFDSGMR